jgi:hypothetical protein
MRLARRAEAVRRQIIASHSLQQHVLAARGGRSSPIVGARGTSRTDVLRLLQSCCNSRSGEELGAREPIEITGGPERTRTSGLRFRKPLLYPAELRDHCVDVVVLRVAVNAPTSSLRQHARNSRVGISGVKPPQALVISGFLVTSAWTRTGL